MPDWSNRPPELAPLVSVLMVARNTGPYIGAAIASARAQTWPNLEIVVLDDASDDDTRAIAERHAAADRRVRVLDGPRAGLAAIRNASLAAARGRYAAILDSDDLLHPEHIGRLVAAAEATDAEIVVANMVEFGDAGRGDGSRRVRLFASGQDWARARRIAIDEYVEGNTIGAEVVLGYLKPLFDLEFLRAEGLQYDPALRIGEDFDLVFRAMLAGARLHYLPEPGYFYRKHAASTSARTPVADLEAQIASDDRYRLPQTYGLLLARSRRRRAMEAALRSTRALAALKQGRPWLSIVQLGANGGAWRAFGGSLREAAGKRLGRLRWRGRKAEAKRVALVLGAGATEGVAAESIARMQAEGMVIVALEPTVAGGCTLADALPEPALIVLADPAAAAWLPFAIAPDAPVVAPVSDRLRVPAMAGAAQ